MQSAVLKSEDVPFALKKADANAVAFVALGRDALAIKAGTSVTIDATTHTFEAETDIVLFEPAAGTDYDVWVDPDGNAVAFKRGEAPDLVGATVIGGFHFAPGGNAVALTGGDDLPAINPYSFWDLNWRPACADPSGMALIDGRFWADIYLTGTDHAAAGTSRFGQPIADGRSLRKLDFEAAKAILTQHGKQLLSAEDFFAMAYGVTERTSCEDEPEATGLDAARTSRWGIMQATGNMWVWGTDGHPDDPRPSLFGGSWVSGSVAGSRFADLVCWPGNSGGRIGVRGRSDHLNHG